MQNIYIYYYVVFVCCDAEDAFKALLKLHEVAQQVLLQQEFSLPSICVGFVHLQRVLSLLKLPVKAQRNQLASRTSASIPLNTPCNAAILFSRCRTDPTVVSRLETEGCSLDFFFDELQSQDKKTPANVKNAVDALVMLISAARGLCTSGVFYVLHTSISDSSSDALANVASCVQVNLLAAL